MNKFKLSFFKLKLVLKLNPGERFKVGSRASMRLVLKKDDQAPSSANFRHDFLGSGFEQVSIFFQPSGRSSVMVSFWLGRGDPKCLHS